MIKISIFNKTNDALIVDAFKNQTSIKLLDSCNLRPYCTLCYSSSWSRLLPRSSKWHKFRWWSVINIDSLHWSSTIQHEYKSRKTKNATKIKPNYKLSHNHFIKTSSQYKHVTERYPYEIFNAASRQCQTMDNIIRRKKKEQSIRSNNKYIDTTVIHEAEELRQLLAAFQSVPYSRRHHCMLHLASLPPANIHHQWRFNVGNII